LGKTSNASKDTWNAKNYVQVKASVKPEIAQAFESACETAEVSMAGVLSDFMQNYAALPATRKPPVISTASRRHRRKALAIILPLLVQIRDAEERYRDNIPENLSASSAYDAADECVSAISDAIDFLESAYL
jgi:hypothetical protein